MEIKRFEVYQTNLNPTRGSKIQKSRPCLIISPDEMNRHLNTVIIAPMTTKTKKYPTRIQCKFKNKTGQIVLDRIKTIDKSRLTKILGLISETTQTEVSARLQEMFVL